MLDTNALKKACGNFLANSQIRPTSKVGRSMIHAFWLGAITQSGDDVLPYITICLMCGRHEDLVEMEFRK